MNRGAHRRTASGRRCVQHRPTCLTGACSGAASPQRGVHPHVVRRPVRRIPRARGIARLLGLIAVVCVLAWGGARVAIAQTEAATTVTIHRVQPGETLWGIVDRHYDDSGTDIRRLIQDVMEANGLSDAALLPGQTIELPVVFK